MGIVQRIHCGEVEGLRAGRFDRGVNTAAICYRFGTALIDSGCANRWRQVRRFVRERPLTHLLLTHHHEDHSGNAARIQKMTGARVLAPALALRPLASGWRMYPYQHLLFGRPKRLQAETVPDSIELEGGYRLQVLAAQGHAADLVCYLEPERGWLFSGDLFIAEKTRYLRRDEDLALLLQSLKKVLRYDFQTIFCGHRGVITDGKRALAAKLAYLEELCAKVRELSRQGVPAKAITRRLLGREDVVSLVTGFQFTKGNLVRACLQCVDQSDFL
ncbi:glyoxylase-like metal-dependent hydrolase (beta-lactamase superfamily II) [Geothermobacter ehrlichii]|uniref:Glyoxylase-like metal-dependent hydrolase (Beta-lactamase superfamily II) n=1 Tax=Geothermobacter ehrlichii TaxID=213224 RepID=A0A5D3WGV8_9BACT|nr:MBL fold metallo-hydrolase [Geothermobacter ehrlichii]TYO95820.1 glyoxylase-like metal-dependent hydrolase (beta-lactamase superfamily II) [Geothermobacter ehrlichii]